MTDDVVTNAKPQVATPADLAAAREARGMSQVDISQRIKLQVRQVNALEEGQWDALPGKSFVRGALRSYGKLLDVDVTALLDSIGGFAEPAEVQGMRPLDSAISRSSGLGLNGGSRGGSPILWVIAGLIGVVALVLYFGADQDATRIRSWLPSGKTPAEAPADPAPATTPPAPTSETAPSPSMVPGSGSQPAAQSPTQSSTQSTAQSPYQSTVASTGTSASPPASGAAANSTASAAGSGPVLSALSVLPRSEPAAATAVAAAPSATASAVPAETGIAAIPATPSRPASAGAAAGASGADVAASLSAASSPDASSASGSGSATGAASAGATSVKGVVRLKALDQDSWVEVRQADGSALHNGLIKAGDSLELSGKPPYRLVLGNASHLELVYEGKAQDLAPHMRANNIARLQLK